ncbi:Predicted Zn-dependent peptidase [Ruaniaceae bacterium KH17]|nr:Predicted Zn-dependent peptidase [Ruaniaceae bacterium KH17]
MPAPFSVMPLGPDSQFTFDADGVQIQRSIAPGGIRVLTETIPGSRSASIGAWVAAGSRDEDDAHAGSTHFLEHLLFKGTPSRSALDIAEAFDAVGGEANAATAKNYTCYYARVLDADSQMAIEVIMDMVTSSLLAEDEFELERGVILEELAMSADDPSEVLHDSFAEAVLAPHPLARPIGGTPDRIAALHRTHVLDYYRRTYVPSELVITAAGSLAHEDVLRAVIAGAERAGWDLGTGAAPAPRRTATDAIYAPPVRLAIARPIEQTHIVVGGRGLANGDPRRFALNVASTILGGGMSSRLFQEVREKRGLAYSTYAFASSYAEAGLFGAYAACAPAKADAVIDLLISERERMRGVTDAELERAIGQISGGFVLGIEDSASRMSRLGSAEIVTGELLSVDEILARYRSVTAEDIREVIEFLTTDEPTVVTVGPELSS